MASPVLEHPTIGRVHGVLGKGVRRFLGVQYASLKDRLAEPEEIQVYDGRDIDATKLGPQAISHPNGCDFEYSLIQQSLPRPTFELSDRNCLHLNINVPNDAKSLPVLVFIHGGGFAAGSASWPQYDLSTLVELSVALGKPFVGVTVNYRLGVAGFLTSDELRNAGYKANNGFRDQRAALRWIKHNIEGFGGNPGLVTLAGQSAGAVASMLHLQSSDALFQQLISMSGTPLLLPHLPSVATEGAYSALSAALKINHLAAEERVKYILECAPEDLYERAPLDTPLLPVVDGEIVTALPTYEQVLKGGLDDLFPGMKWCQALLIGDCQFDGSIYKAALDRHRPELAKRFDQFLKENLLDDTSAVAMFEEAYQIYPGISDEAATLNILQWATDIAFSLPAVTLCHAWAGRSHQYHINEPNPWEGFGKGESTHILDVALLFQKFDAHLPVAQRDRARVMAEDFIQFIHGEEPFPSHQSNPTGARVYGPDGVELTSSARAADFGRRSHLQKLQEYIDFDVMNNLLGGVLAKEW